MFIGRGVHKLHKLFNVEQPHCLQSRTSRRMLRLINCIAQPKFGAMRPDSLSSLNVAYANDLLAIIDAADQKTVSNLRSKTIGSDLRASALAALQPALSLAVPGSSSAFPKSLLSPELAEITGTSHGSAHGKVAGYAAASHRS